MLASAIVHFGAGVSAAIVAKLASGVDDVLWLSVFFTPHLNRKERLRNMLTYTSACLSQTGLAFIISKFGSTVIDDLLGGSDDQHISTDRLVTLISGSALFLYSIYLGIDYYKEKFPGQDEHFEAVAQQNSPSDSIREVDDDDYSDCEVGDLPAVMETMEIEEQERFDDETVVNNKQSRSLAIVAFLGSMDDLTLFVPLLVSNALTILQLAIGVMVATVFISVVCISLTRCQFVANFLEKIPLVAIVGTFSVIILANGILFME
jgi:cadmium resistance protein CadD (predicted permease)